MEKRVHWHQSRHEWIPTLTQNLVEETLQDATSSGDLVFQCFYQEGKYQNLQLPLPQYPDEW